MRRFVSNDKGPPLCNNSDKDDDAASCSRKVCEPPANASHQEPEIGTTATAAAAAVELVAATSRPPVRKNDSAKPRIGEFNSSIDFLDDSVNLPQFVKSHSTTLTFPEKLMLMLTHVERETAKSGKAEGEASIGWILGGTGFAVRNKEHLCAIWLMLFFGQVKFSSFERKLYRWGFRKLNMTPHPAVKYPEHVHFFGHESFQRNNRELLSQMKSETAAKKRRALAAEAAKQALFPHQTNSGVTEAQQLNSQVMVQDTNHGYNAWAYCNILPQHLSLSVEPGVLAGMGQADMVQHAANLTALQALLGTTPSQVGRPGPQDLSIPNPFFGRRPTQTSSVVQASEEQSSDYNQLMRHFDSTFRRR